MEGEPAAASDVPVPRVRRGVKGMRTAASKVPMKWVTLGTTTLFVAATAAFGGLEDAPPKSIPVLQAGESFVRSDLTFTVTAAGLSDSRWAEPDDPERQLFIDVEVLNLGPSFISSATDGALGPLAVDGFDELEFPRMTRPGESSTAVLQPLVPTTVRMQWDVPREAFAEGDEIRVILPNAKPRQMFTQSAIVWDVTPGAYVDVVLVDLGQEE